MSWQAFWVSVAHKVSSQSDTSNRHVAWRLRPRAFSGLWHPCQPEAAQSPGVWGLRLAGSLFRIGACRVQTEKAEVAHPLQTPPPRMACLLEAWLSLNNIRQPETAGLSLFL